jgi:hypothetical protein
MLSAPDSHPGGAQRSHKRPVRSAAGGHRSAPAVARSPEWVGCLGCQTERSSVHGCWARSARREAANFRSAVARAPSARSVGRPSPHRRHARYNVALSTPSRSAAPLTPTWIASSSASWAAARSRATRDGAHGPGGGVDSPSPHRANAALLRDVPPDRSRLLTHTTDQRQLAEQGLAEATAREQTARDLVAELGQGAGRLLHRRELTQARDQHALAQTAAALARQQADRAADRQRQARRAQQQHLAYQERHAGLLAADRARARELAWRNRVELRALELERPGWLRELGQPPASIKGQRAWRQAAAHILQYRERYGITDPEHALGPEPRHGDLEQRRHHRATRQVIERLYALQGIHREQRSDRHELAQVDRPLTRPTRAGRTRSARANERERVVTTARRAERSFGRIR